MARANEAAEKAKENATKASQKTAELNIRSVALEKESTQAKLETEKLKQQFAWRRLSKEQVAIISDGVSKLNGGLPITLSAITSDPESMTFASDLQHAINLGGLDIKIQASIFFGQKPFIGIEISGPDKETIEKAAQPFINAGLILNGHISPNEKEVNIRIGSKPFPDLD